MKKVMLSLLFIAGAAFSSIAQQVVTAGAPPAKPASELLKEALHRAANEHKNVFVMFHASWCGWCHKMDKSMNDSACSKFFSENYVIVHLVVDESKGKEHLENPGAAELKVKYHGEGQGIPYWLVLDKDDKLLADSRIRKEGQGPEEGDNAGCPATANEVEFFIEVLKKTSDIRVTEAAAIRKRFRQNDN